MTTDFENLANTAVSDGYFQFKFEKNWSRPEPVKHNECFSVDMTKLSTLLNCTRFNEYLEIDEKYFTQDQLTLFNTTADEARTAYNNTLIKEAQAKNLKEKQTIQKNNNLNTNNADTEEDLDFLLSLTAPSRSTSVAFTNTPSKSIKEPVPKSSDTSSSRSMDLEQWLDSVLED